MSGELPENTLYELVLVTSRRQDATYALLLICFSCKHHCLSRRPKDAVHRNKGWLLVSISYKQLSRDCTWSGSLNVSTRPLFCYLASMGHFAFITEQVLRRWLLRGTRIEITLRYKCKTRMYTIYSDSNTCHRIKHTKNSALIRRGFYYKSRQRRCFILDAFANFWNYLCHVCPSDWKKLGFHWAQFHKFWYWRIFRKSAKEIQVSLKSDENNGYFTWQPMHVYDNTRVGILIWQRCCNFWYSTPTEFIFSQTLDVLPKVM